MERTFDSSRGTSDLERYFAPFRDEIVGLNRMFRTPVGWRRILYADWAAGGRMYRPIEAKLTHELGPFAANTHTDSTVTSAVVSAVYREAKAIIKRHVHAGPNDILLFCGNGMTAAVNKLQRIMGLKLPGGWKERTRLREEDRPVIFLTHMEHHSNQISWMETVGDVHVLEPAPDGRVDPRKLEEALRGYSNRRMKIGAFTSCSNVTGIETPLAELAAVMHRHGGLAFADWTASAPYADLDMHPASPEERLDAVYFSPHKFLGGPGSSGVLLFDARLSASGAPDHPGGGTVVWTDPWGGCTYVEDAEEREDGGSPGWLQAARAALCIRLKERMGTDAMRRRERELVGMLLDGLDTIPGVVILDGHIRDRLGFVSFYADGVPYPLFVRLLNDRFGVQSRGGCSCAGTYGHYLFGLDRKTSERIRFEVETGDSTRKPGWVRLSLHPVMTDAEIRHILYAVRCIMRFAPLWRRDYRYDKRNNDYIHKLRPSLNGMGRFFQL